MIIVGVIQWTGFSKPEPVRLYGFDDVIHTARRTRANSGPIQHMLDKLNVVYAVKLMKSLVK